jgi:hypothetical protein
MSPRVERDATRFPSLDRHHQPSSTVEKASSACTSPSSPSRNHLSTGTALHTTQSTLPTIPPSPIMDPTPTPASTSSTSTFLSSHYLSTIPPDSINDLQSFLDDQRRAEQEAREAMPFQTGECSWERGYVKQSVWACRGESVWGVLPFDP